MNRRQRKRRVVRRRAHQETSGRPRNVMSRARYAKVDKAHIVPVVYQRNFAISEQVAVHIEGQASCVLNNIRDAGTRSAYYRRTRRDGTSIDDIEASLSHIEDAVRPVFEEITQGAALTFDRKGVLAQFFGVQIVRGPAFFEDGRAYINKLVQGLSAKDVRPKALADAGGDLTIVREQVRELYLDRTQELVTMLTTSFKMASILGSMRWQLLHLADAVLAYSDHPVVVWPWEFDRSIPFARPHIDAMSAVEVRIPISPNLAILMTWADLADTPNPIGADARFAGEINAFTTAQADKQWMHQPGAEPPIATGSCTPLSAALEPGYTIERARRSHRRRHVAQYLRRVRKKRFLSNIEIVDI
jgi:hypothetical protein